MSEKSAKKDTLVLEMEVMNFICCKVVYDTGTPAPDIEQIGERLMAFIPDSITQKMFSAPVMVELFQVFRRYYERYGELPTREPFMPFLEKDRMFQQYYEKAEYQQKEVYTNTLRRLFKPLKNTKYMVEKIEGLLVQLGVHDIFLQLQKGQMAGDSPRKALDDTVMETLKLQRKVQWVIDASELDIVDPTTLEADDYSDLSALTTVFPGFNFYRSRMSVLLAPAKLGKTRFSVNVAYQKAKEGMDILYADSENGTREIQIRITSLMIEELEDIGYAPPREAFYSDCFLNPRWFQKNLVVPVHRAPELLQKGDKIGRARYFTRQTEEDGRVVQKWFAELDIFEVIAPQAQLSALPKEPRSTDTFDLVETIGDRSWTLNMERMNAKLSKARIPEKIKGSIRIISDRKMKPSTLSSVLKELRMDRTTTHFKDPWSTLVVLDWVGKMDIDGKANSTWEKSREKYFQYGNLMEKHMCYMLAIDGVSNPEECTKAQVQVSKVLPKDNRQISYDAAQVHVLAQTEEEKARRCVRLMVKESQFGGSTVYIRTNANYSAMDEISWSDFASLCPETWAEIQSSGKTQTVQSEIASQMNDLGGDGLFMDMM